MSLLINPYRFDAGATYLDEVLADSPLLLWKLDETSGTAAADSSGNSRPGTYNGSPTLASGTGYPDGTSAPYFGSSKYVQSNAALSTGGGTFSVECWFRKDDYLAGQTASINSLIGDLSSTSNGFLARWNGDTTTLTTYWAVGGGYTTLTCTTAEDTLYHYVATTNGTVTKVYLNGSEVATSNFAAAGFNLNFRVARSEDGRYMLGEVGWAAVYGTALSPTRVAAHYAAG